MAVVREGRRLNLSPSLLAAVLLIENRALDTAAVSSQGAVGLMQVMPVHAGSYGCASTDLKELDANICHGAGLLRLYVVRSRTLRLALRRYNGCVRGTVTPRCSRYPARVLATAASVRREMLRIAAQDGMIIGMAGRRID
jgi:soluble lytic murein transglycosylase-like protein